MRTTSVFRSGNSQAVRIPADLAFPSGRVTIEIDGDALILRPAPQSMAEFVAAIPVVPDAPFYEDDSEFDTDPDEL